MVEWSLVLFGRECFCFRISFGGEGSRCGECRMFSRGQVTKTYWKQSPQILAVRLVFDSEVPVHGILPDYDPTLVILGSRTLKAIVNDCELAQRVVCWNCDWSLYVSLAYKLHSVQDTFKHCCKVKN
jgi:hypothetical protein